MRVSEQSFSQREMLNLSRYVLPIIQLGIIDLSMIIPYAIGLRQRRILGCRCKWPWAKRTRKGPRKVTRWLSSRALLDARLPKFLTVLNWLFVSLWNCNTCISLSLSISPCLESIWIQSSVRVPCAWQRAPNWSYLFKISRLDSRELNRVSMGAKTPSAIWGTILLNLSWVSVILDVYVRVLALAPT